MSTDFHTAHPFGGALSSSALNSRLADLDAGVGIMKRRGLRVQTLDAGTNASPCVVAHRGFARSIPENTIAAMDAALSAGAKVLEIDVQFTFDGVPVIMHDEDDISRVTSNVGGPNNYSYPELRAMDAGSWYNSYWSAETIPSLYDVFNHFGGSCTYIIEIKDGITAGGSRATAADAVAEIIADYGLQDHCVLASFDDLSASTAFDTYGIPFLRYTGSPAADGSIGGISVATLYAAGYRYVGIEAGNANLADAAAAWAAAGAKVIVWTIDSQYDRDVALAAPDVTILLANDPVYIDLNRTVSVPVGSNIPFNTAVMPTGCTAFKASGGVRIVDDPGDQLVVGYNSTSIGYPVADSSSANRSIVLGPLGWGGSGIGKISADMKLVAAAGDTTRWGGLDVYTDDRGHITGCGTDTSTGYRLILRESGSLELYTINSAGTETLIGSDATGAALSVGSTYTLTLEVTSTQVIGTGNGKTVTVANTTYRGLTVPGLTRNKSGVTFDSVKRAV